MGITQRVLMWSILRNYSTIVGHTIVKNHYCGNKMIGE